MYHFTTSKLKCDVPGEGGCLASNTLLQASVTGDHEGVVVEEIKARLVEGGSHVSLSHGETDSVAKTLTKGSLRKEMV